MRSKERRKRKNKGQATTEYVMLLAVLASVILVLGVTFKKKIQGLLQNRVASVIQDQFFNTNRLHRYRIGIPK